MSLLNSLNKLTYLRNIDIRLAWNFPYLSWLNTLTVSSFQYGMVLSVIFVVFFNKAFFMASAKTINDISLVGIAFIVSLAIVMWLLTFLVINFILIPGIVKPFSIFLLIAGSFAAYFMDSYGVVIDKEMLRNVLETDFQESMDLVSVKLMAYVFLLGLLPSLLVLKVNISWASPFREIFIRVSTVTVVLLCALTIILCFSSFYSSFFRIHKEVRFLTNPLGFIYGGISLAHQSKQRPVSLDPISQGAILGSGTTAQSKPVLVVLVVGETARAANFGLSGYSRNTTPLLQKQDIVYFDNVLACGTSTAVSLPCMFSALSRHDYTNTKAKSQHNLLDFISAANVDVLWRDNNSGCKGTCSRVEYENFPAENFPDWCDEESCFDEVLLQNLDDKLNGKNKLIVMHQKGSHGPGYDQRYPESMRFYTPVCQTNQLQDCTQEQVVNAYDNTIRYTDYFLNQLIQWLRSKNDSYNTVMVYVSDHGESLGENRIYLHGMPYAVAPQVQKHVPFIFWASSDFYEDRHLSKECMTSNKSNSYSHDNLFHSILGLLDIKTPYYQLSLDLFSPCNQPR